MKKCNLFISLFVLSTFISCSDEGGPNGKINVTLEANSAFKNENPDSNTTKVIWGCVVLSESQTACMYYYNGVLQLDGSVSQEAQQAGPGTTGLTFVASETTFTGLEGGERMYAFYSALFSNSDGSVVGAIDDLNGPLDLYANPGKEGEAGEDINWVVSFGSNGAPSVNIN